MQLINIEKESGFLFFYPCYNSRYNERGFIMDQIISTGLQMMQVDLSIKQETLCVIRALNTIKFDDLHKIICHKLSISSSIVYSFFLPKTNIVVRKITRSFDESAMSPLATFVQTGDTIYYRIYNSEIHVRFSSMGIVDEATTIKAKLLVTQSKIKHVLRKENIIYRNEISNYTVQQLYKLSNQLLDNHMYQYFPNQSFLMMHIGNMLQPIYIENQEEQCLLYFFQTEESFRRFVCVFKDTLPNQTIYKYKQATILRFAKNPLAFIASHCYKGTYISFLDMQRGWELDGISEEMAHDFLITLPILLETIYNMREHQMQFHDKRKILHIYDIPQQPIKLEMKSFETMILPIVPYEVQHNILALLEIEFVETYIEIDYRFIRQLSTGSKDERNAYLLNVSAVGPSFQSHYEQPFEKEEDVRNAFLDLMVSVIEENGRPQVIKVKDRYVYSLLNDICQKLNIFVQIEPRLLYLEAYYTDNKRVIYDMETTGNQMELKNSPVTIKKAVDEQPLQHQYSRKRYKMKAYFN